LLQSQFTDNAVSFLSNNAVALPPFPPSLIRRP
jgi:hypothetical protein